jgi:hypothetical protein
MGIAVSNEDARSMLEEVFGKENVISEWDVAKNSRDALQRGLQYCPRIDFAIKPLNIDRRIEKNQRSINHAYRHFENLIHAFKRNSHAFGQWALNENPRCFLAIEYENRTTTKHRLGSLINAGAIGKVGIVVAMNTKVYRSYERILKYLEFLQQQRKMNVLRNNYVVIERDRFETVLREYVGHH